MSESREQSIRKQSARLNQELPTVIKNKPELRDDEFFLWKSFWELDTERPVSAESLRPIPITKYYEYAVYISVPRDYLFRFIYCLRQLDMHLVNVTNDKIAKARADARVRSRSKVR